MQSSKGLGAILVWCALFCAVLVSQARADQYYPGSPVVHSAGPGGSGSGAVTGSGTTNNVTKWTGANTIGNGSMVDDGTKVVMAIAQNAATTLSVFNATNGTLASSDVILGDVALSANYLDCGYAPTNNTNTVDLAGRGYCGTGTTTTGLTLNIGDATKELRVTFGIPTSVANSSVEAIRMTSAGIALGVGAGTSATASHSYDAKSNASAFYTATTAGASSPDVEIYHAKGTIASPTATQSGDELGAYYAGGHNGSAYTTRSRISFRATENWAVNSTGNNVVISTCAIGTGTQTDRVLIDTAGLTVLGAGALIAPSATVAGDVAAATLTHGSGGIIASGLAVALPTCNASAPRPGKILVYIKGSGGTEATSVCACEEVAGVYSWVALSATGDCT